MGDLSGRVKAGDPFVAGDEEFEDWWGLFCLDASAYGDPEEFWIRKWFAWAGWKEAKGGDEIKRLRALLLRATTFEFGELTVCNDCGAPVNAEGNLSCDCFA